MAVLPIVTGHNTAILRTPTTKVPKVTKELLKLIKDMHDTVQDAPGVGLAAPQINRSERICLCFVNRKMTPMINTEITWHSEEVITEEEGCLSIPKEVVLVKRAASIIVKYLDEKGQEQERKFQDFDARVVQHECDHLDGVLIVDYIQEGAVIENASASAL